MILLRHSRVTKALELVVADLVLLPPADGEKQDLLLHLAERQDHAVVEIQRIGEFFVIPVFERGHGVEIEPAAQVGDAAAGHQAEQGVEAVVAHHPQCAVALDAAAFHETGTQAAVVLLVGAALQDGQQVRDGSLVVAVEHHQMLVPVGRRVAESHLMAAAQAVVLVVAQQVHRRFGVAAAPVLHGGFGAVGRTVVDHDARPHPRGHPGVQQLGQDAGHLFFAVVGGDKYQQFFHR